MRALQITTAFPPSLDGIGHYTFQLSEELRTQWGISSRMFVGGLGESNDVPADAVVYGGGDRRKLARFLEDEAELVIVHYVGYGFSRKGCPFWLVGALEQWRERHPDRQLAIFFHELTATGRIWQSAYWLTAIQRGLIRRLLRIANVALSSLEMNTRLLRDWDEANPSKVVSALPVFSNCRELQNVVPHRERENAAVVFGTPGRKSRVYAGGAATLLRLLEGQGISRVYDIGPECRASAPGVPVIRLGELPPEEVSAKLSRCRFGLIDYPPALLGKSGIFAALAAHGVCPILCGEYPSLNETMDGLRAGEHFIAAGENTRIIDSQAIGDTVFRWYQSHTAAVHGRLFGSFATRAARKECRTNG